MLTLTALPDGGEQALSCFGVLCPLQEKNSRGVRLKKHITLEQIGSYTKKLVTPLYRRGVMSSAAVLQPGQNFDSTYCRGALCGGSQLPPTGYVVRNSGAHRFCLPVYDHAAFSSAFYRVCGYMPLEEGFVAVLRRRTALWVTLGLLCGLLFVLSYLVFQYGLEGAWLELANFGISLLP